MNTSARGRTEYDELWLKTSQSYHIVPYHWFENIIGDA